jgi:hypothetical protein
VHLLLFTPSRTPTTSNNLPPVLQVQCRPQQCCSPAVALLQERDQDRDQDQELARESEGRTTRARRCRAEPAARAAGRRSTRLMCPLGLGLGLGLPRRVVMGVWVVV